MKIRITLFVEGDSFNIYQCKEYLDLTNFNLDDAYENIVTFTHRNEFCNYYDEEYEKDFYDFILKNIDLFKSYKATNFSLFIEVYAKSNEQCNFEILNPTFIKLLGENFFSIPISFYLDHSNEMVLTNILS